MLRRKKDDKQVAAERFGKLIKTFGETVGEVFDDPELREKAKEFAKTAVDAAAKFADSKIKDADVKARFRTVGKAAQTLGKSLEDHFKADEGSSKKT